MSDPYAETDEWPTPPLPARPVFDRADNTARLALEVASLKRENAALRAEVERLHSWDGLLSLLDEHWPEEIFPTTADDDRRDTGPRLIAAIRHAEAAEERLRKVAERADGWATEGVPCECGHTLDTHNGLGCYERLSYEPLVTCGCKLTDDRHDGVMAADILRAVLAAPPAAPEAAHDEGCAEWCNHCEVCGTSTPYGSRCPDHPPAPVSSGEAATGEACCMAGTPLAGPGVTHEVGCTRPAPVVAPSAEEPAEGGAP